MLSRIKVARRALYSAGRDPMLKLTEKEKIALRKDVNRQGQRMFSIAYGIIGGGLVTIVP